MHSPDCSFTPENEQGVIERTHCANGHPMTPENIYVWAKQPHKRRCKECQRVRVRRREVKRKEGVATRRREALESWIPELPPEELAWAAGIFEGEGCVTICDGGRSGYTRTRAILEMTDFEIVEIFGRHWSGHLKRKVKSCEWKPNARDTLLWEINSSSKVAVFAAQLLPYIHSQRVRRKFELVILADAAREQGSRDPQYKEKCHAYKLEMRELNRRGTAGGRTMADAVAPHLEEVIETGALTLTLPGRKGPLLLTG